MILNLNGTMLHHIHVKDASGDAPKVWLNLRPKNGNEIGWITLDLEEAKSLHADLSAWIASKAPVAP